LPHRRHDQIIQFDRKVRHIRKGAWAAEAQNSGVDLTKATQPAGNRAIESSEMTRSPH